WADLWQQENMPPERLAFYSFESARRAKKAIQTIEETYLAAAQFMRRLGIDAQLLLRWVASRSPHDYAEMQVAIELGLVQHQLATERWQQQIKVFEAELRQQMEQESLVERNVLDENTQTVFLDGKDHKIADAKAFAIYAAIVDNRPQPITR